MANIKEYLAALPYLFKAKVTPLVWGIHGIGKSSIPQQFCDSGGHRLFNLRLGNMELGDLLGLADFETDDAGRKVATRFFKPDWLKELFDFCEANPDKFGIIHLDEINRVRKDMMNPVFQIALEYQLHTYKFPKNVRVIGSANPPVEGYWVNDFTESALLDRFCHIKLQPEIGEWIQHATRLGLHDDWIDFIQDQPHQLHSTQVSFSIDEYCKPSNRSTEAAARLYSDGAPQELVYGCVGATSGASFYAFVANRKEVTLTAEDILKYTKKTRVQIAKLTENGKYATIKSLCERLSEYAETRTEAYTMKEGANVCEFLREIPIDIAFGAARTLVKYVELARVLSYDPDADGKGYEVQDKLVKHFEDALKSGILDRTAFEKAESDKKEV